jgi:tRNA 2-thiocytidine biosynthesis protein TtcA
MKRQEKAIYERIRDASLKYRLIEEDDRIAVGMSGGKDSLALLYFLNLMKSRVPFSFELVPINIDLGFKNDITCLQQYCLLLGYSLHVESTDIGKIAFSSNRKDSSPCALCAHLRRGALNRTAKNLGCNKTALGHHMNDVVNTLFMCMIYERRFNVFKPRTYLSRMDITVIRPLVYVEESRINDFVSSEGIKPVVNNCPACGKTKRKEIDLLVNSLDKLHPGIRQDFLAAIENVNYECFWQ